MPPRPAPTVLISGASIAGPALAHRLTEVGWSVTLVERFAELRDDGQNIDVRGAGREVVRRMGIEDAIRDATTGEQGIRFVDDRGRTVASFAAGESDSDGATAELEILRGQLSRILYDRTKDRAEYLFGDQITALDDPALDDPEGSAGVTVTLRDGGRRTFDLVVIAEGLRSRTRALVFPDVDPVRELGLYVAYLTLPRTAADTPFWHWYVAGRGRSVTLRPDNVGTTRAGLTFLADTPGIEDLDRAGQVAILRRVFADAGWETPRVLAALDDAPFYFEAVGQARLPSWSRGRIVLAGDAAHCSSPLSGMSTSLALTGAYVLAGELAAATTDAGVDHRRAFRRYEEVLRPYVDQAQKLQPGVPRIAHPRSDTVVRLARSVLKVAASPVARRLSGLAGGLFTPPADAIDLPAYPVTAAARG